jgi:hypothetical protein
VCVALGNVGSVSDIPALECAAADPEPLIAEHAAWAINQIRARHSTNRTDWHTRSTSSAAAAFS